MGWALCTSADALRPDRRPDRRRHPVPSAAVPAARPTPRSSAPAGASRARPSRCGSCARPAARCPSTGPSGARAASSTPSARPTWPPRSPSSPSAATASTPPSSTPTSSCPSHAIGFGVDVAPGRRARSSSSPSARPPTSTGCARSSPRPTCPTCSRRSATWSASCDVPLIGFAGAPFTVASYLVEGAAVAHLTPDQGADARRPGAVGRSCIDRLADLALASLRAQVAAGRVGRPAVRLAGPAPSRPADYERFVLPAQRQGARRAWPTSACPASTSASAPASCSALMAEAGADVVGVDWRVPLDAARAAARPTTSRCRATSTPPLVPGRRGRSPPRAPATCCAATTATPATSSTSATACCPRPTPTVLERVVELVHAEGRADGHPAAEAARDGRRRRHGVRDARPRPTTSSRTTPTSAGAGRPTPEQLADLTAPLRRPRRHVAAGRAHRGPARRHRRPPSTRGRRDASWSRSARSTPRRSSRTASPTLAADGRRRRRRPGARPPLLGRFSVGEYQRAGRGRGRRPAARTVAIDRWCDLDRRGSTSPAAAVTDALGRPARRTTKVLFTAHSLPERVLDGDPYPAELAGQRAAAIADGPGCHVGGLGPGLAERRAHARAVAGPRHPRGHPRPGRDRPRGRAGVRPGLRHRPPRGALRPRHRGPRRRRRASAWPSPAPAPSTTTPR